MSTVGIVACGAIAADVATVAERRGWAIETKPLPPLLHNHPERIAAEVDAALDDLGTRHERLAVAYADCGTYGALDEVCERRGIRRLGGQHCYDVYAGADRIAELMAAEAGTYLLTDFLAASFRRTILAELGLDRRPELRDDYFRHYRRVVWLAQRRTPDLERGAQDAADALGLPLEVVDVGVAGLEHELAALLSPDTPVAPRHDGSSTLTRPSCP
ncbi:MAG: DUF1638 domain-containing protein [Actinomycetota bacterium]|nr:DUF1638 domain-containing protein [Actinomycetota bacterium]